MERASRSVANLEELNMGSPEYDAELFVDCCEKDLKKMSPVEFIKWLLQSYKRNSIVLKENVLYRINAEEVLTHIAILYYSRYRPS